MTKNQLQNVRLVLRRYVKIFKNEERLHGLPSVDEIRKELYKLKLKEIQCKS